MNWRKDLHWHLNVQIFHLKGDSVSLINKSYACYIHNDIALLTHQSDYNERNKEQIIPIFSKNVEQLTIPHH